VAGTQGGSKSVTGGRERERETESRERGGRKDLKISLDPFGINLGLIEFEANTERGRLGAWANLGRAPRLDKYGDGPAAARPAELKVLIAKQPV